MSELSRSDRRRRALITGISGQDGSYLAELLLEKGYEVHGLVRRSVEGDASMRAVRTAAERGPGTLLLHRGDLTDAASIRRVVERAEPEEIYNLGGQSHVGIGFEIPSHTLSTITGGVLAILESIRSIGAPIRLFQASTSEMFGDPATYPQNEQTPFAPKSPYGIAKLAAHQLVGHYRDRYGIFASTAISFNHESPRRSVDFVTRKVTDGAARIALGHADSITLGDLDARRDWGYAPEYVDAMWRMLQATQPGDYVLTTGATHSVRELCEIAFTAIGRDWQAHVKSDPTISWPSNTRPLVGDGGKARQELGWESTTGFDALIRLMVESDLARLRS